MSSSHPQSRTESRATQPESEVQQQAHSSHQLQQPPQQMQQQLQQQQQVTTAAMDSSDANILRNHPQVRASTTRKFRQYHPQYEAHPALNLAWKGTETNGQSSHMENPTAATADLYTGGLHLADFLDTDPQPDNL